MRTAAAVLTAALILAGCSGSGSKTAAPPTTSSTTSTTSSTTSTTVAGPPGCTTTGLNTSLGQTGAAAGHLSVLIVFQNTSGAPCILAGYPGVAGLDPSGNQVAQAARTPRGFIDGLPPGNDAPPVVTLAPGAIASAMVESTDVPQGNATSCSTYPALLVTPPGETHSVQLKDSLIDCSGFEVHPVQPGAPS